MPGKRTERLKLIKARYRKLILEPRLQGEHEPRPDHPDEHQDPWLSKLLHQHAVDDTLDSQLD